MYGCESWTIMKAECWRIDAFELWCWRRLESPSDCKEIQPVHPKGDQSWVFIGRTDAEAEYFGHLMLTHLKRPWCGERLRAGGEGNDRGWDGWVVSLTQWTWVWVDSRSWCWTGGPGVLRFTRSQRVRHDWTDWTDWGRLPCLRVIIQYLEHWLVLSSRYLSRLLFKHVKCVDRWFSH